MNLDAQDFVTDVARVVIEDDGTPEGEGVGEEVLEPVGGEDAE